MVTGLYSPWGPKSCFFRKFSSQSLLAICRDGQHSLFRVPDHRYVQRCLQIPRNCQCSNQVPSQNATAYSDDLQFQQTKRVHAVTIQ